jgi:uncharacterized protein YjbI with pentapeptide repeats
MPAISRTGPILDIHGFVHPINRNYEDLPGGDVSEQSLRFADLYRANLESCTLKKADLRSCYAESANFKNATFTREANGADGDFRFADFEGADFTDARFLDSELYGANLKDARYNDKTQGFTTDQKRIMIAS